MSKPIAAVYKSHPDRHWCVSVLTAFGIYEYLSDKRLITSAISECVQKHGRELPNYSIVQLTARPALHTDVIEEE